MGVRKRARDRPARIGSTAGSGPRAGVGPSLRTVRPLRIGAPAAIIRIGRIVSTGAIGPAPHIVRLGTSRPSFVIPHFVERAPDLALLGGNSRVVPPVSWRHARTPAWRTRPSDSPDRHGSRPTRARKRCARIPGRCARVSSQCVRAPTRLARRARRHGALGPLPARRRRSALGTHGHHARRPGPDRGVTRPQRSRPSRPTAAFDRARTALATPSVVRRRRSVSHPAVAPREVVQAAVADVHVREKRGPASWADPHLPPVRARRRLARIPSPGPIPATAIPNAP